MLSLALAHSFCQCFHNRVPRFNCTLCFPLFICHPHSVFPSCQFSFLSLLLSLPPPSHLSLLQKNEGDLFHRLWHVMNEILDLRRQVLVGHLTHDRMRDVKQHITARLDWGNEWVHAPVMTSEACYFNSDWKDCCCAVVYDSEHYYSSAPLSYELKDLFRGPHMTSGFIYSLWIQIKKSLSGGGFVWRSC